MAGSAFSLYLDPQTGAVLRDLKGRFMSLANTDGQLIFNDRMQALSGKMLEIARTYAPHDTGAFASGLSVQQNGFSGFSIISDNPRLLGWLRTGTGVYAGYGPITASHAKAMVFGPEKWANGPGPGPTGFYVFKTIQGMAANDWEAQALPQMKVDAEFNLRQIGYNIQAYLGYGEVSL